VGGTVNFLYDFLIFTLPVANPAKMACAVAFGDEQFRGASRAPASGSVEDDLHVFRQILHAQIELGDRQMNSAGYGAVLLQLGVFPKVDQKKMVAVIQSFLQFENVNSFGMFHPALLCTNRG
jgi:hypothetical protein